MEALLVNNTRTTERFVVALDVELFVDGAWHEARTRNVSLGGVYVVTPRRLGAAGGKLILRLHVPGTAAPMEAEAIVRWQDLGGGGLQFSGLRAREVYTLGKYLELERQEPR